MLDILPELAARPWLAYVSSMHTPAKKGILLAAFGTGTLDGQRGLRDFNQAATRAFPEIPIRWAFTSDILRERLAQKRQKTDSVQKALEKMIFERFTHIAVQSLHTAPGEEWRDMEAQVLALAREHSNVRLELGAPLLHARDDMQAVAAALLRHLPAERLSDEACILMGHGARQDNGAYGDFAEHLRRADHNAHLALMDGGRTLENVLEELERKKSTADSTPQRVWLLPFLAVAGHHATRDMTGLSPDSWKSRIEARGYECLPVLKGLLEYSAFSELWVARLASAFARLAV